MDKLIILFLKNIIRNYNKVKWEKNDKSKYDTIIVSIHEAGAAGSGARRRDTG